MKRVLALDLATNTGWAIRRSSGEISSGVVPFLPKKDPGDRWVRFHKWVQDSLTFENTDLVIYEAPFIHPKHRNGWGLSFGFVTIVQLLTATHGIKLLSITPTELKQFATGHGGATKDDMLRFAKIELGYKGSDDNEADALHLLNYAVRLLQGKI